MQSIKNIPNLTDKKVLVRCDFDVPLNYKNAKTQKGKKIPIILDDNRLKACLPTIQYLLKKKAKLILIGHLGRPNGKIDSKFSLLPVKNHLEKLLNQLTVSRKQIIINLIPIGRYIGVNATQAVKNIQKDEVLILENLRFSDREQANCKRFAKKLASLADYYINDAFSVSHRNAASVDAIQNYLPSYSGFHLEEELRQLSVIINKPKKPLAVIIGGAKIATKLPVIEKFLTKADYILIGGAVANTFFKVLGFETGKSLIDGEYIKSAENILKKSNYMLQLADYRLLLPVDVRTNSGFKKSNLVAESESILDIGPATIKLYLDIIKSAGTIIWNGPMGKFEDKKFRVGTQKIADAILKSKASSVIGGGETNEIFKNKKIPKNIYISTGGGAMLDYLAGKELPGVKF